jgi:hypothetical protein
VQVYLLNKVARKLLHARLPAPSAEQRLLIDELRKKIAALPAVASDAGPGRCQPLWLQYRSRLRADLLSRDPRGFIEFPVIRETMFVDHPPYIAHELKALRRSAGWGNRWSEAIRESESIPAPRCPYFFSSSGGLIHQAHHLCEFERLTGTDAAAVDTILEFGGGYGGMCRLLHRLGFRGHYFIYDLPEFSALQEFYLRANGIAVRSLESGAPGAICFSEFEQLGQLTKAAPLDLVLATWSLSETPLDFRRQILGALGSRHWLIAYQHVFESLDNDAFFAEWTRRNSTHRWRTVPLSHMPERHSYLFGSPA